MESLIHNYINAPKSAKANFELALAYEEIKQYAGAASHFLRCAEFGDRTKDQDLIYESLLHISLCLGKLGDRTSTEEGWIMHAINFQPQRPEAYLLLSFVYERQTKNLECYTMACLGLQYEDRELHSDIGYEGKWMLIFQKAMAAWRIGRTAEARELFFFVLPDLPLNDKFRDLVQKNMSFMGAGADPFVSFDKKKIEQIRFKFEGYNSFATTYSQSYQDLFVLSMLNGKRKGYYLEIGSADPFWGSNTALLEKDFGWRGLSIEYKEELVKEFRKHRANPVICKDATIINYDKLLRQEMAPTNIDYLQLDCEPPKTTYDILLSIPFERYKFAVITFEHDYYADVSRKYRNLSRRYLLDLGYVLVVPDIGRDYRCPFEDWWVHPDLVDPEIIEKMKGDFSMVNMPELYFFPPLSEPSAPATFTQQEKLEGFPTVNWITLKDSKERQEYMKGMLTKLNLKHRITIAYDGRTTDYMNNEKVEIQHFTNTNEVLNSGGVAASMSHLKAIEKWYKTTTEPIGLFVEDDITFESIEHWNFTWEEVIDNLPKDWKAIQLSVIKNRDLNDNDMKCEWRCWDNWSAFAYMITREYAKELIDKFIKGDKYNLILEHNLIPFTENVVFGPEREGIYTLPLFTENNNQFKSTFFPQFIKEDFKPYQKESSDFILKWWEDNKSINQLKHLFNL